MRNKITATLLLALLNMYAFAQCETNPLFNIALDNNTIYPYYTAQDLGGLVLVELQYDFGDGSSLTMTSTDLVPYTYFQPGAYTLCITQALDDPNTPEEVDCTSTSCYSIEIVCIPDDISLDDVTYNPDGTATLTFSTPSMDANTVWSFQCWPGFPVENTNNSSNQITIDFEGSSYAGLWVTASTWSNTFCTNEFEQFAIDNPAIDCVLNLDATIVNNVVTFEAELFNGNNLTTYPYYQIDFGDGTTTTSTFEMVPTINHAYTAIGTYEACFTSEAFYEDSCPAEACITIVVDSIDQSCTAQYEYFAATSGHIQTINNSLGYYNEVEWSVNNSILSTDESLNYQVITSWPADLTLTISNSITGCLSSVTHTIDPLNETFSICGTMFYDSVDNNWFDQGEAGLPFETIEIHQNQVLIQTIVTDANGEYCVTLPVSTMPYTITPIYSVAPNAPFYPGATTYGASWSNISGTLDFGTNFTLGQPDVSVSLSGFGNISAANGSTAYAYLFNNSDQTITETMTFTIGPNATIAAVSIPGTNSDNDHVFTATVTLLPFQYIQAIFVLSISATVPLGSFEHGTLSFVVPNDIDNSDNSASCTFIVATSYDPNNKLVEPRGDGPNGNIAPDSEWLTYTINFQNTGNAPAINVRIEDEIETTLDLSTFEMLSTSHNCTTSIVDNMIIWHFNDIYLPDSTSDEPGSKGFVQFRIKISNGLPLLTTIGNDAAIFFDYNDPIITNTAINTLFDIDNSITESSTSEIQIFPNPADRQIQFNAELPVQSIRIFDMSGRIVYQKDALIDIQFIDLPDLPEGLYTIEANTKASQLRQNLLIQHR
jgi:hypothetical protein